MPVSGVPPERGKRAGRRGRQKERRGKAWRPPSVPIPRRPQEPCKVALVRSLRSGARRGRPRAGRRRASSDRRAAAGRRAKGDSHLFGERQPGRRGSRGRALPPAPRPAVPEPGPPGYPAPARFCGRSVILEPCGCRAKLWRAAAGPREPAGRGCSGAPGAWTLIEGNFLRAPAPRARPTADQGPSRLPVLRRPAPSFSKVTDRLFRVEVVGT